LFFCFSFLTFVSSSCPRVFHVERYGLAGIFSWSCSVFRKTCSAVNWFTFCWFKRNRSNFATISAFDFSHLFLRNVISPLFCLSRKGSSYSVGQAQVINENSSITIYVWSLIKKRLKNFRKLVCDILLDGCSSHSGYLSVIPSF